MYSMIALIPSDGPLISNGVPRTDTGESKSIALPKMTKKNGKSSFRMMLEIL